MPVDGLDIPDSDAAGHKPQTLKSERCSRKGECVNRRSISLRASFSNLLRSAAVYPSPRIRKSTFSEDGPCCSKVMSEPGEGGTAASTNGAFGLTAIRQISWNAFLASRFFRTIRTGAVGAGKRN